MRYLSLYKSVESGPPTQAEMETMGLLIQKWMAAGTLLGAEGCLPSVRGMRIRLSDGKITVTDGPFTEAKEVVGGYSLIEAKTHADAVALATRFMELHRTHWPDFEGESEVRPLEDMGDAPGA